jgi:hypothetical protein
MYERLALWLVFALGTTLGYRGAEPVIAVLVVAMLLTLPRFVKVPEARTLSLVTVMTGLNAVLFASAAYATGRGIAWLLTT